MLRNWNQVRHTVSLTLYSGFSEVEPDMHDELKKAVESLIVRAAKASTPEEAMRLSQAACNAANAMARLQEISLA